LSRFVIAACLIGGMAPGHALAQAMQLPGAQPATPQGAIQSTAPSAGTSTAAKPKAKRAPAVVKAPTEDGVIGIALKRNGGQGTATIERHPSGLVLKLTAEGYQINNLTEPCAVAFDDRGLALTPVGKPAGTMRYKLEAPVCPVVFDVLDGAILVQEPAEPCMIAAAACRIEMRGIWAPDAVGLVAKTREIEQMRSKAESAVREGFKSLGARLPSSEKRAIAREQAGFSSERAQVCREFLREGTHGFCQAKFTEARATDLRARAAAFDPKARREAGRAKAGSTPQ
jgi:hypothetical protein